MKIVKEQVTLEELKKMAEKMFGDMVKAVVDIEKEIMVVDADMHADEEALLLESGSEQNNLWGINLHPEEKNSEEWIEFDSMINLRPSWGNKSRGVDDPKIQEIIKKIVNKLVTK
ncbi:MAG: DUF5674 family protein [bacterium]